LTLSGELRSRVKALGYDRWVGSIHVHCE
jgi:hypothetical protein